MPNAECPMHNAQDGPETQGPRRNAVINRLALSIEHWALGLGHCQAVICSGATSSGTSMRALVPRPGSLLRVSW